MSKHTPGPWKVHRLSPNNYTWVYSTKDEVEGGLVARLHPRPGEDDQHNARLIAAAPEMAACLRNVCLAPGFEFMPDEVCRQVTDLLDRVECGE